MFVGFMPSVILTIVRQMTTVQSSTVHLRAVRLIEYRIPQHSLPQSTVHSRNNALLNTAVQCSTKPAVPQPIAKALQH